MKINIIGYSGSGKSTLAKSLGLYYHCPYLYLDSVHFIENWQERPQQEALEKVKAFMSLESYVIDGNYRQFFFQERMAQTDWIIFLNFNRFACLWRAYARYLKNRNQVRESSGEKCIEKFDWEFFLWIIKDGRTASKKREYRDLQKQYPQKWIEIKNQRQLNHFYQHFHERLK